MNKVNLRVSLILLALLFMLMLALGCERETTGQGEMTVNEEEAISGDDIFNGEETCIDVIDNIDLGSQEENDQHEEPSASDIKNNEEFEQQVEVSEEIAEIIEQIDRGYFESMYAAYWLLEQGEDIVPYLDQVLSIYDWPEIYGAYPLNVYWALGHIGGDEAEQVLLKHASEDEDAGLALKGLRSRKHNPNKGIMSFDSEVMSQPRIESEALDSVNRGDTIIILDSFIVNEEEIGPRGGYAIYDYIKVVDTNIDGYVQRIGVDFSIRF